MSFSLLHRRGSDENHRFSGLSHKKGESTDSRKLLAAQHLDDARGSEAALHDDASAVLVSDGADHRGIGGNGFRAQEFERVINLVGSNKGNKAAFVREV